MIVFRCFQSRKVEILFFVFWCWKKPFKNGIDSWHFFLWVFPWTYLALPVWTNVNKRCQKETFLLLEGLYQNFLLVDTSKKKWPFFRHRLTVNYAVISSLEIYWLQNTLDLLFWFKSNLWLQSICDIFWSQSPAYLIQLAFTKLCCFQQENFMFAPRYGYCNLLAAQCRNQSRLGWWDVWFTMNCLWLTVCLWFTLINRFCF